VYKLKLKETLLNNNIRIQMNNLIEYIFLFGVKRNSEKFNYILAVIIILPNLTVVIV